MQLAEKMEAYLSEARGKDPGVVAELFLKKINYNEWKVYHDYIRFYQAGRQVLAAMEAKSGPEGDRFRQFVKKLRKDEATEGKTIQEFMMLPIQHITRYGLLLVRLRSYSKEGSDQAEKIKDAENYMREVGNTLERIQTREEGIRAMFQLFYSVENVPVSFVSYSQRRFQGEYAAVDIDGHCLGFGLDPAEGFKKPTGFGLDEAVGGRGGPAGTSAEPAAATVAAGPRRLFLFSDCILVAAGSSTAVLDGAAAGPSSKKLELVARLPFSVITAIEEEDENILRLQCVNGSRLETFRFRLEDAKKRQALALAIQLSLTQQSRQGMGRWWNSG
ncbi:hypothetical protein DFJ73DRAFT_73351 [Zopfochytrium polystomum]|nr:hypothetical protein DFJ73DRAFT_73351 [Zopfochytrium polystomum]